MNRRYPISFGNRKQTQLGQVIGDPYLVIPQLRSQESVAFNIMSTGSLNDIGGGGISTGDLHLLVTHFPFLWEDYKEMGSRTHPLPPINVNPQPQSIDRMVGAPPTAV